MRPKGATYNTAKKKVQPLATPEGLLPLSIASASRGKTNTLESRMIPTITKKRASLSLDAAREEQVRQRLPRSIRQAQRAVPRQRMQPWPRGHSHRASSRRYSRSCLILSLPNAGVMTTTTIAQRPRRAARRPRGPRGAKSAAYPRTSGIGSRRIGKRSPRRGRLARVRSGAQRADTRAARGAGDARLAW